MRRIFYIAVVFAAFAQHVSESSAESCIPGFDFAIFAKNGVHIQGNATTDSWDSSQGTYGATASCGDASVGTNSTTGGAFYIQGNSSTVCGDGRVGAGGNPSTVITGNGNITGTRAAQTTNTTLPNVSVPSLPNASPFSPSFQNSNATLAPGKTYGTVSCKNGSLTLSAGTYVVSNLSLTSNCALTVGSGPISVYFKTSLSLHGGAIANSSGIPSNLVFYGASTATDVSLQGGAGAFAAIYAPSAACEVHGNGDLYGAMVCDSAHVQGNAHIHFDKALRNFSGGGFACTFSEISRSSPVVASIGGRDAVVQGTFESNSTARKTITTTASVASWEFPYLKGHMRARLASSITTTASSFSSGTVLFDAAAAGKIPPPDNAGCATFTGSCRHLFTTTGSTLFHPTLVSLDDTTASEVGAIIAPTSVVSGIGPAHWQTIVRAVLAGSLGGVDRSTVAVIGPSTVAGNGARPQMVYFGGADGMLHAVCAQTGGTTATGTNICPSPGTELWGFIPREQLPLMRTNLQRIDGSPHVLDVFGDFNDPPTGVRSWHTILMFQTGSTYALDVTDPANPSVVWEYLTPGTGMTIASGQVTIVGVPTYLAFVETNNGPGAAGVVTTAINIVSGERQWAFSYEYPSPPRGSSADLPLPATGVPGGAAAVDLAGGGFVTDVVFGDLYGNLWRLNAVTGDSRNGADTPLFSFSSNKHPIGVVPTIYSNGGQQFAFFASGGYVDPTATSWSASTQSMIAVRLAATGGPITEADTACSTCDLVIASTLTSGDKGFSQAVVIGGQLFVTSDSTDVNASTFGTGSASTGHMTAIDLADGTVGSTVVIAAGAATLASSGTSLYTSSATQQQELSTQAASTTGEATEITGTQAFKRLLWLRTK